MPNDKLKLDAVRLDDEMLSILEFKEGATEVEKKAVKERWKAAIADGTLVILYSDDGQVIEIQGDEEWETMIKEQFRKMLKQQKNP